jgi:integrase
MPRVAKFKPSEPSRKAIPADVRDEYAKRFGKRREERFYRPLGDARIALAKFREWQSDIEARFASIRAERTGEGRALSVKEARALAGEWYGWFAALMGMNQWPADVWERYEAYARDQLYGPAIAGGVFAGDPVDLLESDAGMRARVRESGFIADEGKSRQFLAAKGLTLDKASEAILLDFVARDFFAALAFLARQARGDYSEDEYAKRFPPSGASADPSLTPWGLFERWITSAAPAAATVNRWRAVFLGLQRDFPNTPAAALLPEQVQAWAVGLIVSDKTSETVRTAKTVRDVWVRAARTVFSWAVEQKLIVRNPFIDCSVKVPRKTSTRETKAFTTAEIGTLLRASLAITVRRKSEAAKRWAPWLAAYSGARMGEITQLRGADIVEEDGVHAMKIAPEAGTVKAGKPRSVPIHEHVMAQGFLDFVKGAGKGPLFYNVPKKPKPGEVQPPSDPTNPRRPRAVKARERLAEWVREVGVSDPELSPNHAWRHTFRAITDRCGIPEKMTDAIVGHAPASTRRGYGVATLADKAAALAVFPRYKTAEH